MARAQPLANTTYAANSAANEASDAAGFYLWNIATDTVYADAAAAESFGFSVEEARAGLPIESFLTRMHVDDLPDVAKAIQETMITGAPFQSEYRVCRPDNSVVELLAMGTCFKDQYGNPALYAGILFPHVQPQPGTVSALELLLLAHDAAMNEGNTEAAERIIDAMAALGGIEPQVAAIMATASRH